MVKNPNVKEEIRSTSPEKIRELDDEHDRKQVLQTMRDNLAVATRAFDEAHLKYLKGGIDLEKNEKSLQDITNRLNALKELNEKYTVKIEED